MTKGTPLQDQRKATTVQHTPPILATITDEILNRIELRPSAADAATLLHLLRDLGRL